MSNIKKRQRLKTALTPIIKNDVPEQIIDNIIEIIDRSMSWADVKDFEKSLNKINNMKKLFETFKETFNRIDEKKVSNVLKTHFEVVIALINYMETEEGISIDEPVKTKNGFIYYDSDGEETEVIIKGKKADIVGGAKNITVDQFANFITGGEPEILLETI